MNRHYNTGVTLSSLKGMKAAGEKIACLSAYDASFARVLDNTGIDVVLVGDSLGVVIQGYDTTMPVSVTDMVYHCRCVTRAVSRALVICDMPFMSYSTVGDALRNATRLIQKGGAQVVKLEAGEHQVDIVRELTAWGIACCGHIGLRPQWVHKLGGYKAQAKDPVSVKQLLSEARALDEAGADLLVLECVPADVGSTVSREVGIPVIGIGAGARCDGQILVLHDVLGITDPAPRFAKNFLEGHDSVKTAIAAYIAAVKAVDFPAREHIYPA